MGDICLYTVGHSKHPIEKLIELLKRHEVEVLVDIRSHPMSRFHPQFNKKRLEESLTEAAVQYVFMGQELGGRPQGEQFYDDEGFVLYNVMAQSAAFKAALGELMELAKEKAVVIMCSEEDPDTCHRRLLVGKALLADKKWDVVLHHIRGTGAVLKEARGDVSEQLALFPKDGEWKSPKPSSKPSKGR